MISFRIYLVYCHPLWLHLSAAGQTLGLISTLKLYLLKVQGRQELSRLKLRHVIKSLVTHIAFYCKKIVFCLFGLLLYVTINNYCHVGTVKAIESDVKQYIKQTRISFHNKTQVYVDGLCVTRPSFIPSVCASCKNRLLHV